MLHKDEPPYILGYRVGGGEVKLGEMASEPVTMITKLHFNI